MRRGYAIASQSQLTSTTKSFDEDREHLAMKGLQNGDIDQLTGSLYGNLSDIDTMRSSAANLNDLANAADPTTGGGAGGNVNNGNAGASNDKEEDMTVVLISPNGAIADTRSDFYELTGRAIGSVNVKLAVFMFAFGVLIFSDMFTDNVLSKFDNSTLGMNPNTKGTFIQLLVYTLLLIVLEMMISARVI